MNRSSLMGALSVSRPLMLILTVSALALSACSGPAAEAPETQAPAEKTPAARAAPTSIAPAPASAPAAADSAAATTAIAGAPAFAVVYPGAELKGAPTFADSPAGPGGILDFTTSATPDEVTAFYKARAEAAGLKTIASMSQGGNAAYQAGDGAGGRGKMLMVVASPLEGRTEVQLSWSAGV